jgi:hypothetical protein
MSSTSTDTSGRPAINESGPKALLYPTATATAWALPTTSEWTRIPRKSLTCHVLRRAFSGSGTAILCPRA